MRFSSGSTGLATILSIVSIVHAYNATVNATVVAPRVMIISMFAPEAAVWPAPYNLTTNYTLPGLSPKFPQVHCNANGTLCLLTTDEGTANAAASLTALTLSAQFDLAKTYFMVAGIAGIKPEVASVGSATFARYVVDIDLIHAVTGSDQPANFTSAFWGQGTDRPGVLPTERYGSEIFGLNATLRSAAANLAYTQGNLSSLDTTALAGFRAMYNTSDYLRARDPPSVYECDTATGDVYWYGQGYQEFVSNWTSLLTNGTGNYCSTQQEDSATVNSLLRAANVGAVDMDRIVILRTASDFDKPPPGMDLETFLDDGQGGAFAVSIKALYAAGKPFVDAVVGNWTAWSNGVPAGLGNSTAFVY